MLDIIILIEKVNIIDIDRIHLCSDSIIGSIRNGHRSNILITINLNEAPGSKIVREPNLVLYKHIDKDKLRFYRILVWRRFW